MNFEDAPICDLEPRVSRYFKRVLAEDSIAVEGLPPWVYNGGDRQYIGNGLVARQKLRRRHLRNIGLIRGYRLQAGLKVRGQKTKSTGRRNKKSKKPG